jgi:hypothetical protein
MANNYEIEAQAREEISEIIADDSRWALFVQQVKQQGIDLSQHVNARERGGTETGYRAFLEVLYVSCSATQICDTCDYNPNHRRGQRRFSAKRRFDCTWSETDGAVLEERIDRKVPAWLDVERNLCPHYFMDLTKV